MIVNNSKYKWIEKGYELFGMEGPDGIQIERLARIVDMNKSGIYHYFGDRETYIEDLLEYHKGKVDSYCSEILMLTDFYPGYVELMLRNKNVVMFHVQLSKNRHRKMFQEVFIKTNQRLDPKLIPLFSKFFGIKHNDQLTLKLYEMLRDIFISRVTHKNLNEDFILDLAFEFKDVLIKLNRLVS